MAKRRGQRPVGGLFTQQEREAKVADKTTVLDVPDLTLDWERFRPIRCWTRTLISSSRSLASLPKADALRSMRC
jgi:hypothetical protein